MKNIYLPQLKKDEINAIEKMSDSEMNSILRDLSGTNYYVAILKYVLERCLIVQHAINSIDSFKEPTKMARHQGILAGISDLPEAINVLNTQSSKSGDKKDN